jgi:hypothetical protein
VPTEGIIVFSLENYHSLLRDVHIQETNSEKYLKQQTIFFYILIKKFFEDCRLLGCDFI